jgi:hypothetical protein
VFGKNLLLIGKKNAKFCEGKPSYIGGISKQKKNHWSGIQKSIQQE